MFRRSWLFFRLPAPRRLPCGILFAAVNPLLVLGPGTFSFARTTKLSFLCAAISVSLPQDRLKHSTCGATFAMAFSHTRGD